MVKKLRKMLFASLILFGAMLILIACSSSETSNDSASQNTGDSSNQTETETSNESPITIRISTGLPATHHAVQNVLDRWAEEVEKRSNGRIKTEKYYGGALHNSSESLQALQNDITDLTEVWPAYFPGVFDLFDVGSIAGLAPNAYVFAMANEELYPEYTKELYESQGIQLAFMAPLSNKALISSKPVESFDDIEGMKIRSGDSFSTEYIKAVGANPVTIPSSEIYTGLQTGVIDAAHYHASGGYSFKLYEVAPYVITNIFNSNSPAPYAFNPKTWEKLPDDLKQIIYEVNMEATMWAAESYEKGEEIARQDGEAKGWKFVTLPESEVAKFEEKISEAAEKQIQDLEQKGYNAREYYEKLKETVNKYKDMSVEELLEYRKNNLIPMDQLY